jgi:hypothetical protein
VGCSVSTKTGSRFYAFPLSSVCIIITVSLKYSQFAVIVLVMRFVYMKVITCRYMNIFSYSVRVTLDEP